MEQDQLAKNLLANRSCANCRYFYQWDHPHNGDPVDDCCNKEREGKMLPKERTCELWVPESIGSKRPHIFITSSRVKTHKI